MLKTQPVTPLETIYEESGSFASSIIDNQHRTNHHQCFYYRSHEIINGLISARSIPSVDMQRNLSNGQQQKLPIEVRYRDGSKRYIHPSLTQKIMRNRRKAFPSSSSSHPSHDLSSKKQLSNVKYRQVINSNSKDKRNQSKPPLVLTFITSDELNQAGIISTDESEQSTLTRSQSNSSIDTIKAGNSNRKAVSFEHLPNANVSNRSTPNNRGQSLTPSQSVHPSPNQQLSTVSIQSSAINSPKRPASSLYITLTNDENERNTSYQSNLSNGMSSSKPSNGTVQNVTQPHTTVFVGGGSHSAFRPFFKPVPFNSQGHLITPRGPITFNRRPFSALQQQQQQQQQQIIPYSYQQYGQMLPSNMARSSFQPHSSVNTNNLNPNFNNAIVPHNPYNSMISNEILSDALINPSQHVNSLVPMITSNYQQQSAPSPNNKVDRSFRLSNALTVASPLGQNISFGMDPNTKWYNVQSNSVYEVPHLSTRYSRIPLRITIPVLTPTHNQKLVFRHDVALENRLLNAGLSPETVALYERILDLAENRQMARLSPPKMIDQYPF